MKRVYNLGSQILGSIGVASLLLGVALATQPIANAGVTPPEAVDGKCYSTILKCNSEGCDSASTDCPDKNKCFCRQSGGR